MLVNACLWAVGLEDAVKPDGEVGLVGPYNPVTYRSGGHRRGVKPADLAGWDSPIMSESAPVLPGKKKTPKKRKETLLVME